MLVLVLINADEAVPLTRDAILQAWSLPLVPLITLLLLLFLYLRGWQQARKTRSHELPPWRAWCFAAGILSLWIALASPIDALDDFLLTAHMLQHFILMSVAPPLLILGAPVVPILRGIPRRLIRSLLRPLFRAGWIRALTHFVTHPVFAWIAMNTAYLGWHIPRAFELTFQSEQIHDFEHLCFFGSSLLFWWIVLAPWPARSRWPRWAIIPYLLSSDVLNTILSATLCFAGRVLYPSYAAAPRVSSLTGLQDQVAAGAEMWVLNSTVFLIPAVAIAVQQLMPRGLRAAQHPHPPSPLPTASR